MHRCAGISTLAYGLLVIDAVGRIGIREQSTKSGLYDRGSAEGRAHFPKAGGSTCSPFNLVYLRDLRLRFCGIGRERLIGILAGTRCEQPRRFADSAKRGQLVGNTMGGGGQRRKISAPRRNVERSRRFVGRGEGVISRKSLLCCLQ